MYIKGRGWSQGVGLRLTKASLLSDASFSKQGAIAIASFLLDRRGGTCKRTRSRKVYRRLNSQRFFTRDL